MDSSVGGSSGLGAFEFISLLTILTTVAIFIACLVIIISLFAKNLKEANTMLAPLIVVASFLPMLTMFSDTIPTSITPYLIPIYGSVLALKGVFIAELTTNILIVVILVNLIYSAIIVALINVFIKKAKMTSDI